MWLRLGYSVHSPPPDFAASVGAYIKLTMCMMLFLTATSAPIITKIKVGSRNATVTYQGPETHYEKRSGQKLIMVEKTLLNQRIENIYFNWSLFKVGGPYKIVSIYILFWFLHIVKSRGGRKRIQSGGRRGGGLCNISGAVEHVTSIGGAGGGGGTSQPDNSFRTTSSSI